MPRVRFTDPAMKSFNGYFGPHRFVNGVSTDALNHMDIQRMAAITQIKAIDEETGEESFTGVAHELVASRRAGAPMSADPKTLESEPAKEEEIPAPVDSEPAKPAPTDEEKEAIKEAEALENEIAQAEDEQKAEVKVYTKEELEEIADEKGIKGLREVADPMGVKDTSIEGLISEIIAAQGTE